MIKISGITKSFDKVRSLNNVSLCIEKGSIFGLIGSNGSGKSTLIRIMTGIYLPDRGEVTYDGVPVWENPLVKKDLVYLSDDQYFIPHATIADMMRLYQSVYPNFSEERYRELLKAFGLEEGRKVSTLSKGMQKQVSIALGIACRPKYLFCDETFDGLDPVMRQFVKRILAEDVAEYGLCAVMASHNLRELEDICDHIGLLHKGELVLEKELDEAKTIMHKIQISFEKSVCSAMENVLSDLRPISLERRGSLFTMIVRGEEEELTEKLNGYAPLFMEFIPLTLEEIFISEMEEKGYEFG
jgi:ABC-2 type transport system ATP-binding protein